MLQLPCLMRGPTRSAWCVHMPARMPSDRMNCQDLNPGDQPRQFHRNCGLSSRYNTNWAAYTELRIRFKVQLNSAYTCETCSSKLPGSHLHSGRCPMVQSDIWCELGDDRQDRWSCALDRCSTTRCWMLHNGPLTWEGPAYNLMVSHLWCEALLGLPL